MKNQLKSIRIHLKLNKFPYDKKVFANSTKFYTSVKSKKKSISLNHKNIFKTWTAFLVIVNWFSIGIFENFFTDLCVPVVNVHTINFVARILRVSSSLIFRFGQTVAPKSVDSVSMLLCAWNGEWNSTINLSLCRKKMGQLLKLNNDLSCNATITYMSRKGKFMSDWYSWCNCFFGCKHNRVQFKKKKKIANNARALTDSLRICA